MHKQKINGLIILHCIPKEKFLNLFSAIDITNIKLTCKYNNYILNNTIEEENFLKTTFLLLKQYNLYFELFRNIPIIRINKDFIQQTLRNKLDQNNIINCKQQYKNEKTYLEENKNTIKFLVV